MLNKEKYMDELMKYACEGSRFAVLKDSGDIEKMCKRELQGVHI